jgi:hypothetical protein
MYFSVSRRGSAICSTILGVVLAYSPAAEALDFAYSANASGGYTDNVKRTAEKDSEGIASAGAAFSLQHVGAHMSADAVGDFSVVDYLSNTYDTRVIGAFSGFGLWQISPDRFEWVLQDNFGQTRLDQFSAVTPENRENINYLTTGPNFSFRLMEDTSAELAGRYSAVTYETSPFDHDEYEGELTIEHRMSRASHFSLNARSVHIRFDDHTAATDYDKNEYYALYGVQGARTYAEVQLGYNELKEGFTSDGTLARLSVRRVVSASSTISLDAGREFSSTAAVFRQLQTVGVVDQSTQLLEASGDPFTHTYGTASWNFGKGRTGLALALWHEQEKYERATTRNRKLNRVTATLTRDLTPVLSAAVRYEHVKEKYDEVDQSATDTDGNVALTWKVGRTVALGLIFERFTRRGEVADDRFQENQFWLTFNFGAGTPRNQMIGPMSTPTLAR